MEFLGASDVTRFSGVWPGAKIGCTELSGTVGMSAFYYSRSDSSNAASPLSTLYRHRNSLFLVIITCFITCMELLPSPECSRG